jgi:hypothetical protein
MLVRTIRGGHFFYRNPNKNFGFFGSSIRLGFLHLRILVFDIVIGFRRMLNRNTKKIKY